MQIRLIPPSPHPTILYGVTFPNVLPLHQLGPGASLPAAWSSQLQLLTSILNLDPPSSIHMLDRAVGLVARVGHLTMDVPQKEFTVAFVDGQQASIPMSSDCIRMLLGVVDDVQGCSESESQRNSIESCASPGSTAGSMDAFPTTSSTKSPKLGKHRRQRSLLFSLISSLVPKALSSPPRSPPPSGAPPPAPLPPLPTPCHVTSPPSSPRQAYFPSTNPDHLRKRARATIVDVWRRHVIPALSAQHLPAAGYVEWALIALENSTRAEIESMEIPKSRVHGLNGALAGDGRHKRVQSEGRYALDFGDRRHNSDLENWRYRPPSSFPDMAQSEETDQVVYPRRDQEEWGIRYVHSPRFDDGDIFTVEYNGLNESLLREQFATDDNWDDNEPLAFQLARVAHHGTSYIDSRSSGVDDSQLHLDDLPVDCGSDNCGKSADMTFDMSRCPLTPSDINDDEGSDDSQTSLRTPEDGEDLPLAPRVPLQSNMVSRASSSRPRSRNASTQLSRISPNSPHSANDSPRADCGDVQAGEYITSRLDYLERVCTALEVVRGRAREEGWRLVRATLIGAKNGWMDAETERSLEIKAKRRAWSSGIKIPAPYPTSRPASKAWDGNLSSVGSPVRPPGLKSRSKGTPRTRQPILPTGLALGIPLQSSPLAMYVWSVDDEQRSMPSFLSPVRVPETIEGKRSSRMTFTDCVTKLFPVCEDENEALFEADQVGAVGFPQVVPVSVETEEYEYGLMEGVAERNDDLPPLCPLRPPPRVRTTSMHPSLPASSAPTSPVLPMFRPSTPAPSYQVAVGNGSSIPNEKEGGLDASSLLLQPLSTLSIEKRNSSISSRPPSPQPPPTSNAPFVPRPRSVSLPTPKSCSGSNKTRRTSFHQKDEYFEDLSRTYASPPPEGPLVISAMPATHEQYPKYAHIHSPSPTPAGRKGMNTSILPRSGKEVVFEQAGSEFTVGIEVALGRAEEGRVIW